MRLSCKWLRMRALALLAAGLNLATSTGAQTIAQKPTTVPIIGSRNTVTADPPISLPTTVPFRVPLYTNFQFGDFIPKSFTYNPPVGSPRRWAKVIFVADFSVNSGSQFDRTCQVSIGRVNVYYGTTAEPRRNVGPTWHVERDITDYSALLHAPQHGIANLGNVVNSKYTGLITGSASLLFYPADRANPAPSTPDMVLPIPNTPSGVQGLASSSDLLSETFTFPTNVTRAYLDLITQSQIGDEFWYLGVPDALANKLQTFGGTAFREAEVRVDGVPAGLAPVYPWIYTGGIDPNLWSPIPGVQTLNFLPYRVDLTPFAARFSNGKPHSVTVQLFNSHNYFSVAGTLLLYQDHGAKTVTGRLTEDTLTTEPDPGVSSNILTTEGSAIGPVSVLSERHFTIAGYVDTSRGKVSTVIRQTAHFSSLQHFDIAAETQAQAVRQVTDVRSETKTKVGTVLTDLQESVHYALLFNQNTTADTHKAGSQTISVSQGLGINRILQRNGSAPRATAMTESVQSSDTVLNHPRPGNTAHPHLKSSSEYRFVDANGTVYARALSSTNGVLTSATTNRQ